MSQTYTELSEKIESNDTNKIMNNFFSACENGSQEELKKSVSNLIKNGISINIRKNNIQAEYNGLMFACKTGNLTAVNFLLEQEGIVVTAVAPIPFTELNINALDIACEKGHREIVKKLLHTSSWENLKYGRNKKNPETAPIIMAEIFLRSVTKEVNKDKKGTNSHKKAKYIKAAIDERSFVEIRARKIYAGLEADEKSTLAEKQKAFITLVTKIGLTEQSFTAEKLVLAKNSQAFTANIGEKVNNNNVDLSITPSNS